MNSAEAIASLSRKALPSQDSPAVERACAWLASVADMLREKNLAYGDSVATPLHIFSKLSPKEGTGVRIDDKLKRIAMGNVNTVGEDAARDLAGYLAFWATLPDGKEGA